MRAPLKALPGRLEARPSAKAKPRTRTSGVEARALCGHVRGMDLDLSPLFQPFQLGPLTLPNRFVLPGMQRQWCENGVPLPKLGDYYRRCVEGGVGLVITESCAVDHTSSTQVPLFTRITPATQDAWAGIVAKVKSAGGPMLMQLWHEGAIRKE